METEKSNFITVGLHTLNKLAKVDSFLKTQINKEGILFIVWGWTMFISYLVEYLPSRFFVLNQTQVYWDLIITGLVVSALALTLYYSLRQASHPKPEAYVSVGYIWVSLIIGLMSINLILHNILAEINFELQHPIFMVFIAFAIVNTGRILRHRLVLLGGVVFALLGFISSSLVLADQLLLEAVAWLLAFVIPGHILYLGSNK